MLLLAYTLRRLVQATSSGLNIVLCMHDIHNLALHVVNWRGQIMGQKIGHIDLYKFMKYIL